MKKTSFLLLVFLFINISGYILYLGYTRSPGEKDTIDIAVAGPFRHQSGREMLRGVNLYLNEIHHQVGGKNINLLLYDDDNDEETAETAARKIVDESEALIVIGHYGDRPSAAAGEIYKTARIPAVSGSLMDDDVTSRNAWYFRVNPGNRIQTLVIANRMAAEFPGRGVYIVFEDSDYGLSLLKQFEYHANHIGLTILGVSNLDGSKPDIQARQISGIREALGRSDRPVNLFLATRASAGAKMIFHLSDMRSNIEIFGAEEFSLPEWLAELTKHGVEKEKVQFLSNGVHCTLPFLHSTASPTGYRFERAYFNIHRSAPTWVTACYYDAIRVSIEAIARAEIRSTQQVMQNRRNVRDSLASMFKSAGSVEGVSGNICFDDRGDVTRPFGMAFYREGQLVSDLYQYRNVYTSPIKIDHVFEKMLTGELISHNGQLMAGGYILDIQVDDIHIHEMDFDHQQCGMDFNLIFRHASRYDFDPECVDFMNSVNPIVLENPVSVDSSGIETTRTYRIHDRFYYRADYRNFPFDRQTIPIRFRGKADLSQDVLLTLDEEKTPSVVLFNAPEGEEAETGWVLRSVITRKDSAGWNKDVCLPTFIDPMNLKDQSQFSIEMELVRNNSQIRQKVFLPLLLLFACLYLTWFTPPGKLTVNMLLFIVVLSATASFHGHLLYVFPAVYIMAAEYLVFGVYILTLVSLCNSIVIYRLNREGKTDVLRMVQRFGRLAYPVSTAVAWFMFILAYGGASS